jgi:signal transduction histidine kinase
MNQGLFPENLSNILDKFDPAADSSNPRDRGNGLSFISYKTLVECMGGQIWLNSPGPGREFSIFFTLPLVTSQLLLCGFLLSSFFVFQVA